MKPLVFLLLFLSCCIASAHDVERKKCRSENDLCRYVLRCIKKGDSLGLRAVVPTVNELLLAQVEERVPGAFRIDEDEAKKIVHGIDSLAMASFRRARSATSSIPGRYLKLTNIESTEQAGDMPYRDIRAEIGKGSLSCNLEIEGAMGFSSGWTLGWGGFSIACVQE